MHKNQSSSQSHLSGQVGRPPEEVAPGLVRESPPVIKRLSGDVAYFVEVARVHAQALAGAGWSAADAAELLALRQRFIEALRARGRGKADALLAQRQAVELTRQTTRFRRHLVAAAQTLVADRKVEVPRLLLRIGRVADSPAGALAWLAEAQGSVDSLEGALQPLLSFDPAHRLKELMTGLLDAKSRRERARLEVQAQSAIVRACGLASVRLLAKLRAAAHNAFAEQRAVLRQFRAPGPRRATPEVPSGDEGRGAPVAQKAS